MNSLYKAAELLKAGWCRGRSREELPSGTSYCSSGAIWEVYGGFDGFKLSTDVEGYASDMTLLGQTIMENYPDTFRGYDTSDQELQQVVIEFNDHVAQNFDEVLAMFEKAAAKRDEYEQVGELV